MSHLRPNKRKRSEFLQVRTLCGMSEQDRADFSYADLERFFRVQLWDWSHTCSYEECPFPNMRIETFEESTLDHIVPRSKGGRTRLSNLQLMHAPCNVKKSNTMPSHIPRHAFTPVASRVGTASKMQRTIQTKKQMLNDMETA